MYKVVLCGLGAVGLTFGVKFNNSPIDFRVLADKNRIFRYTHEEKPIFNGEVQYFNYINPQERYEADLIIIATKSMGLTSAIANIKNCIGERTRIISLINGVTSEKFIMQKYPHTKVLKSYFIGHSAVRNGNKTTQDGVGKIVTEHDDAVENILRISDIDFETPNDINYSMWLKYTLNLFSNQTSAILNMTFGEMKNNKNFMNFAKKVINEVKQIAGYEGINNLENLEKDALDALNIMCNEGKTSMLQDILAKRPTEVDIFGGEIIRLGEKYGVNTPYNQVLYDLIKIKEEQNEYSIHSC